MHEVHSGVFDAGRGSVLNGGLILLDCNGRIGIASNAMRMAWGLRTTATSKVSVAGPIVALLEG